MELVAPKLTDCRNNYFETEHDGIQNRWDRLKTEFGKSKTVVAAHMEEIINLPMTRGSNYERVREFYEKLSTD